MLSGNGRHRRPRQVPAIVVAAGVTGSAIALPLLATGSANAADGTTWDHVAECESGGSWSANSGNGYFGGLQLTQDDWEAYGGLKYAESADEASRSQQIAVAQRILDDKGASAFGTCAVLTGLGHDRRSADVNTGVDDGSDASHGSSSHGNTSGSSDDSGVGGLLGDDGGDGSGGSSGDSDLPLSSGSSDSTGLSDSSGSAGLSDTSGSSATPGSSGRMSDSPAEGSGSASPDPGASLGTGADSGVTGLPDGSDSSAGGRQYGGGSSRFVDDGPAAGVSGLVDTGAVAGSGRHRGADASAATSPSTDGGSGRHAAPADGTYTVRSGDSLEGIADALHVHGGWERLYDLNKDTVGTDASHIVPGQTLRTGA